MVDVPPLLVITTSVVVVVVISRGTVSEWVL